MVHEIKTINTENCRRREREMQNLLLFCLAFFTRHHTPYAITQVTRVSLAVATSYFCPPNQKTKTVFFFPSILIGVGAHGTVDV